MLDGVHYSIREIAEMVGWDDYKMNFFPWYYVLVNIQRTHARNRGGYLHDPAKRREIQIKAYLTATEDFLMLYDKGYYNEVDNSDWLIRTKALLEKFIIEYTLSDDTRKRAHECLDVLEKEH